jgi:signal transduction histidine kinase
MPTPTEASRPKGYPILLPFHASSFPTIRGTFRGYAFACVIVGLVFAVRLILVPATGTGAPYILFFSAVLLTSILSGTGAGLITIGLSAPLAAYFFVIKAGYPLHEAFFQAILYSIEGVMVAYLSVAFTESKHELEIKSAALIKNKEKLDEAIRARDDFLSMAAHELKTPLTALKIQAQFMRRSIQKGDEFVYSKKQVDTLTDQTERQVTRLSRLVNDMFDIARIRSGNLKLHLEQFDLCGLVKESVEQMLPQFIEAGCKAPTLFICETSLVKWDRGQVEQVLNNLFTNAIKYGKRKPIKICVEQLGTYVRLSVKDQGIGITPEVQGKIFNRFERAVHPSEISGLGLGLFISREIIAAHGGRIWVESKLGDGATFFVELPIIAVTKGQYSNGEKQNTKSKSA